MTPRNGATSSPRQGPKSRNEQQDCKCIAQIRSTGMADGITGWRLHVGVIFPTPVPPRAVLEFYEAVPQGVDMTTVSLTIQQLSDNDMDEAIKERAAKQLANFDVDVIYQS